MVFGDFIISFSKRKKLIILKYCAKNRSSGDGLLYPDKNHRLNYACTRIFS